MLGAVLVARPRLAVRVVLAIRAVLAVGVVLAALDGLTIDLYLVHAPDPRTPWGTSVRALARLVDDGLVRSVGLSNVNRPQLDEALDVMRMTHP